MMRTIPVLFVLLMMRLPLIAAAQEPEPFYAIAPVQVEVVSGDQQWSYDCYPSAQPASEHRMTVYLNTPNGLAMYACDLVGRVLIIPAVPSLGFTLAGLFEPFVLEGGDA